MSTLFKVQYQLPGTTEVHEALYPSKGAGEKEMTRLRNDGVDTTLVELDLKAVGVGKLSTKELMCRLFNQQDYAESGKVIKKLAGLKHAKK